MKYKTFLYAGIMIVFIILCMAGFYLYQKAQPNAEKIWLSYIEYLNEGNYEKMYNQTNEDTQKTMSLNSFVNRNKRIYEGIQANNIHVEIEDITKNDKGKELFYTISFDTIAGHFEEENKVTLIKESKTYKVDWNDSLIFSALQEEDRIALTTQEGKRGDIFDRNNDKIATTGDVMQVCIVPGDMHTKEETIAALANVLQISTDVIETKLNAAWVKDDLLVPIKTIAVNTIEPDILKQIPGVKINIVQERVYPYGKAAAHLSGYIATITQEELAKHPDEGYQVNSMIGKTGLEAIYEKELHGRDGYTIAIQNKGVQKILLQLPKQDGNDIKTTIDMNTQNALYEQIKDDAGAAVALHPQTGETLALVSSPAYDPNTFILGMDNATWDDLNKDTKQPLRNRFIASYTPGSTFKAITGAIGLESKTITNDSEYQKVANWKWQKDRSWGNYFVPTTHEYNEPSNLSNALIYSDNIYFAQLADAIGHKTFTSYLKQFGFNEDMEYAYPVATSTYGSDDEMENAMNLAVSGFGQGKLQLSPIHLTNLYTLFVNGGNIVQPYLIFEEGAQKIWKKQIISSDNARIIYNDLIKTFDQFGDNHTKTGAKTGTAQVGDTEIGWICGVRDNLAVTIMIDDTIHRGGSAYNVPMLQNIMKQIP